MPTLPNSNKIVSMILGGGLLLGMCGCPPTPVDPPPEVPEVSIEAPVEAPVQNPEPEPKPEPVTPDVEADVSVLKDAKVDLKLNEQGQVVAADCKLAALKNDQIKHFKGLPNLETLSLENAEITDEALNVLADLPNLKTLSLRRCTNITEGGLNLLPELAPQLERLLLLYTNTKNTGLIPVGKLVNLNVLDLRGCMQISDAGLAHIAGLQDLVDLKLRSYVITDAGMQHLGALKKLKYLAMEDCGVGNAGMADLAGLKNLEVFNVMRTVVGDEGLKHFAENKFRDLRLRETAVTGPGLDYLKSSLDTLTYLDLSETLISNDGLNHITPFTKLKTLSLWNGSMDDAGLVALTGLQDLEDLDLQGCTNLTSGCIEHLLKLEKLQVLNLSETVLDDAGLLQLNALKQLKQLKVGRTSVTDDGIAELQKNLPACNINRDF